MEKNRRLSTIKSYIQKMPSLPTTVTKIMELCNDPHTSPADLNHVISLDPVLMGKVMKLINSAYYGLNQEVTSLVRAIIMLGINTVKNLSLSTAILGTLKSGEIMDVINMDGFWRHSLCVGVTSKLIAKYRNVDQKRLEEYFIAGLLHDIGKIPLNNVISEDYLMAISYSDREHCSLYDSENKVISLNHTDVGKMIVDNWKLGSEIKDPVSFHHNVSSYTGENLEIIYTVAISNYFANTFEIGYSGDRFPERVENHIWKQLNISMDYLEDIEERVNGEIEKAQIFLRMAG